MKATLLLLIAFTISNILFAQPNDTVSFKDVESVSYEQLSNSNSSGSISALGAKSDWEFNLIVIVLIFGLLIISLEVFLIYKQRIKEENILKFIIITLIIIATLFLITAGYNNNQIAPAMGLLGTIAGYLLGKKG